MKHKKSPKERLEEVWVPIVGFSNYAVSNYGRVENVKTGRELKPYFTGKGYLQVKLFSNGVRRPKYVHRLVAQAFFLYYEEGVAVCHKNGIFTDNGVFNLTLGGPCRRGDDA